MKHQLAMLTLAIGAAVAAPAARADALPSDAPAHSPADALPADAPAHSPAEALPAYAAAHSPADALPADAAAHSPADALPAYAPAPSPADALPAHAPAPSPTVPEEVGAQVHRFVAAEVARARPGLRAEITVADIDAHLHLAPCARTEVFLRPGAHLWGHSFVGYRCTQKPGWSISVPVVVRLFGKALVAAEPLQAMQALSASALRSEEVELTREPGGVVESAAQVEDQTITRGIEPGQPIPLNALRAIPAVGQGEAVKLLGVGSGFTISTDGIALATAAAGESVRVRVESGRTIAGVARKGRIVEVGF